MSSKKTKSGRKAPAASPLPARAFRNGRAFGQWLARNHAKSDGLWLRMAKKSSGIPSIAYLEAVEHALCWGWIDGQALGIDERWYMQKFTPRRKRSPWSKINRARAAGLIESGRMQPAGLAEIERAKQDGRWARAYDSPGRATVPADLAAALERNQRAADFFRTLDRRNRYAVLHRVQTAQTPDTRARRIATLVEMLARRKTLYS